MTLENNESNRESVDSPLVTVYITNYNYDQYIREAIESVLEQNFRDFELVIIDDGSTDGSREIIREYADNKKTRVIFQDNKGLNKSIGVALKAARGKYVMRLDADDFLDPNALLVMTRELEQDENLALVFPDYYYVNIAGDVIGQERRNDFENEVTVPDRPAHGACTLFRKRVLEEVGSYSTDYTCQDGYDIWLKIINKYSVKNINLPLFYYRRHGDNLTENTRQVLDTRSEIKKEYVHENRSMPSVLAVVPIRGKIIDPQSPMLDQFGGQPLIEWTLKTVEKVNQISTATISTPDPDIMEYIKNRGGDFQIHERPTELARENVSLQETLEAVLNEVEKQSFDLIAQIIPNTPFRSSRAIEEGITTIKIFPVDLVVGVVSEEDQFYFHDGEGLKPVQQTRYGEDLRLERDRLFRRAGGLQIIETDFLKSDMAEPTIGHVMLQNKEAVEVNNSKELELARRWLDQ